MGTRPHNGSPALVYTHLLGLEHEGSTRLQRPLPLPECTILRRSSTHKSDRRLSSGDFTAGTLIVLPPSLLLVVLSNLLFFALFVLCVNFSVSFFPSLQFCPPVTADVEVAPFTLKDAFTHGKTSLDEGSARRRGLYLYRTQDSQETNIHAPAGLEPAIPTVQRQQTEALDLAGTVPRSASVSVLTLALRCASLSTFSPKTNSV